METILIVDDNRDLRFTLSGILKEEGYDTKAVGDGERALREVKARVPALVLLDIKLPRSDGMKVLREMKTIDKDLVVIMLTAYAGVKGVVEAMKLGAFDYISKPFNNDELVLVVKKALQTRYLSREVESLRKRLDEKNSMEEMMGAGKLVKEVFALVKMVAPTDMIVMLQGESGTGKELIARMVHRESRRVERSFITVDCGVIPETLVESELFGHEKGAFTGADAPKEGIFEQADKGTLFLDEITNLSGAMQMKLLRVLQERCFRRVGGRKDIRIDVRIIAATNIKLSEAVGKERFRDDLYHRLNEFKICLPPLRERKEDIPVLIKRFLKETGREHNKAVKRVSADVMKLLFDYRWPGNVRELKNVVRTSALITEGDEILPSSLPPELRSRDEPAGGSLLKNAAGKAEGDLIKGALAQTGGNKTKAAKLLNMNRKTLYRRMKSLKL